MLHTIVSLIDGFSSLPQRSSLTGVGGPVQTKEKLDKSAWNYFVAVAHVVCQLSMRFFSHLYTLFGNSSLYKLHDVKPFEWHAVKQLQLTARDLSSVFGLLSHAPFSDTADQGAGWGAPDGNRSERRRVRTESSSDSS